jgi:putative addiction module component (TIGR02574 family)
MTVVEVMEEFRKLPSEEQREVFERLRDRFDDDLTPGQIAEFERRAERLRRNPEAGIRWEQVRAELKERLEARRACPAK